MRERSSDRGTRWQEASAGEPAAAVLAGGVLIATDGAPASDDAVRFGLAAAAWRQTRVELLAVSEPLPPDSAVFGVVADPALEVARRRWLVDRIVEQCVRLGAGPAPGPTVMAGRPAQTIADHAGASGASLVVVGHGSHDALSRLVGADTAIGVIRRARVPVVVAPPTVHVPVASLLIATDFSSSAERAARTALALVADDAIVHFVHVAPESGDETWRHVYAEGTRTLFTRWRETLPMPPLGRFTTHLLAGDPVRVIRDFAHQHNVELIAVGSHGYGFVDRLRLGSVSERLLRLAECAVLVAPPDERASSPS